MNQAAWFNSNHYFAGFGDYFAPANHEQPLLHTWSLAVEIQFYLLTPFLVLLLPARALQWLLAALLVGLTAVAEYRLRVLGIQQETYYSLYARLPAFFAGALVALLTRHSSGGGTRLGLGTWVWPWCWPRQRSCVRPCRSRACWSQPQPLQHQKRKQSPQPPLTPLVIYAQRQAAAKPQHQRSRCCTSG